MAAGFPADAAIVDQADHVADRRIEPADGPARLFVQVGEPDTVQSFGEDKVN